MTNLALSLVLFIMSMTLFTMIYFSYKAYLMVFSKDTNGIAKWLLENKEIDDILIMMILLALISFGFILICFL